MWVLNSPFKMAFFKTTLLTDGCEISLETTLFCRKITKGLVLKTSHKKIIITKPGGLN